MLGRHQKRKKEGLICKMNFSMYIDVSFNISTSTMSPLEATLHSESSNIGFMITSQTINSQLSLTIDSLLTPNWLCLSQSPLPSLATFYPFCYHVFQSGHLTTSSSLPHLVRNWALSRSRLTRPLSCNYLISLSLLQLLNLSLSLATIWAFSHLQLLTIFLIWSPSQSNFTFAFHHAIP